MVTASAIATWMFERVKTGETLHQQTAVGEIEDKFGSEFVYDNQNGNRAIRPDILEEFRKLSAELVVWVKAERAWRLRESLDEPHRAQ